VGRAHLGVGRNRVPTAVDVRAVRMGLVVLPGRLVEPVLSHARQARNGNHPPLAGQRPPALQQRELHVGNRVQEVLAFALDLGGGPLDAGNHVGRMVLRRFSQSVGVLDVLSHPEVVVDLEPAGLRFIGTIRVHLVNAAAPLHLGVDQAQQVGHGAVVLGRFLKRNDLVLGGLLDLLLGVGHVPPVVVEAVELIVLEDSHHARQEIGAPARTGRRASRQVPPAADRVAGSRPLLAVVRIVPGEVPTRCVGKNLHAAIVDHLYKAAKSLRIHRRQLVAPEQSVAVVPFVHHVDQLDSMGLQAVEFLFVVLCGLPPRAAGILAHVVDALRGEIVGNQVLAHAPADLLCAEGDVLQTPPVVLRRVAGENRRRLGCAGEGLRRGRVGGLHRVGR